jgi:hypothetical protein
MPRYLSSLVIPVAILAGPGWNMVSEVLTPRIGEAWVRAIASSGVVLGALGFAAFLDTRVPALLVRDGLYREVEDRGLHDAIVMVRAEFPTRYLRNGPYFEGSVLYVRPDQASPETLAAWFPGRVIYEAREGRAWTLRRLVPSS